MAGEIPVYCAFDKIVPLEELKPNPKNPNKHPRDQVEPVPVDFQSYPSDEDELADLLADNRIAEMAEMDNAMLRDLFAELDASDFNVNLSGYTDDVVAALIDVIDGDLEIVGEVPFTEVLREEHNYIVLYFDNEVDWLQAESLFDLETVKALSTRTDGKITGSTERRGVGRVLRGAEALEVLRCAYQCELPKL